jgi:hypothetical protein
MRKIMAITMSYIAMHINNTKVLCEIPFKNKTLTELDVSGKNLGTEGALVRSLILYACAKGKERVLGILKADIKRKEVKPYIPAPEEPNTGRFFGCSGRTRFGGTGHPHAPLSGSHWVPIRPGPNGSRQFQFTK